eukprot:TRINITY_DN5511_c0_g1_i5.p1 TRINITY_DN5511_c0_g1~~TRINITY_DN5511_c0_g1_i5.p1  ORF type:complete len:499 (+),score=57.43 TRINITY_DN5511_c0_g1_i5:175-1671(+)
MFGTGIGSAPACRGSPARTHRTGRESSEDEEKVEMAKIKGVVLECARFVSDAYTQAGLLRSTDAELTDEEYLRHRRDGNLSLKSVERLIKEGGSMVRAVTKWLNGEPFKAVLMSFPPAERVDEGILAKAIRKLAKFIEQLCRAALQLGFSSFAEKLQGVLPKLKRGLPFLPSMWLAEGERGTPTDMCLQDDVLPSYPRCPDDIGSVVAISPSRIGFSHRSCSAHFKDGVQTIRSTLRQILSGRLSTDSIEELRIYWYQGMYYTLGNRRLCVYRLLEQLRPGTQIRARVVCDQEAQAWNWQEKFTSGRWKGAVVLLRHTGEIIGKSREQTTFNASDCAHEEALELTSQPAATLSEEMQGVAIGYWNQLREACDRDAERARELAGLAQLPALQKSSRSSSGPPRKLLDPLTLTDEELMRMNMDWSPCKDCRFEQPSCGEGNGIPCTRKGCTGIFEKTGAQCLFCHAHSAELIARYEAFRGFARRAAKKNVGRHANRRMGY